MLIATAKLYCFQFMHILANTSLTATDITAVRIWSVVHLTKRTAPLISLSIAQHFTNCAVFG